MIVRETFKDKDITYYNKQPSYLRNKPVSIDPIDHCLRLQNDCKRPIDWDNGCLFDLGQEEYIAKLDGGCVGSEGGVFDDESIYVLNNTYPQSPGGGDVIQFDELVTIVQKWGYGYYHWMAECFPRLIQFYKDYDGDLSKVKILTWDTPFVRQYFKLLGIDEQQLVPFKNGVIYKSRKLYIPTPIFCGNPHINSLLDIRNEKSLSGFYPTNFESKTKDTEDRVNILISREGQPKRTLRDFDKLHKLLMENTLNWTRDREKWVIFDGMNIEETIKLFSKAKLIVGVHGAGLVNSVYSPKDCKVIEILPVKDCTINLCHWHTISSLGLNYRMIPVNFNNRASVVSVDFNSVGKTIKSFR